MTLTSQITIDEIKDKLQISDVLEYYGGECTSQASGAWWCIIHEVGGKHKGHKTPSLVAKDERGTATCMSRGCFQSDDIFGVIAKMEHLDLKNDFPAIKEKACRIAGISYNIATDKESSIQEIPSQKDYQGRVSELNNEHLDYLTKIGLRLENVRKWQNDVFLQY